MYNTPQTAIYAATSDYVLSMKKQPHEMHHLMRAFMDVEQERRRPIMIAVGFDQTKIWRRSIGFHSNCKNNKTRKFTSYRGSHTIVEIIKGLNFKVER